MNPLTMVIPTYERPEFLAECLATVAAQTRKDFDLIVLDNASSKDYGPVLERFSALGIEYIRNKTNIGSGANHTKAREICSRSRFGLVFHDDDLMHPRLVEWALEALETHPRVVWAGAECSPFIDGSQPPFELWQSLEGRVEIYDDRTSLLRRILEGAPLHFGSVVFRTDALAVAGPPTEMLRRFHIVADRPYLLELAKQGSTALIREPLALYRIHAAQDTYDPHFTEDQAIELMRYYREILPLDLSPEDERLFLRHSTNYLLHAHAFTRPENRSPFRDAVKREKAEGLFRWRSIDGQGVAAVASSIGLGDAYATVRPALGSLKRAIKSKW